MISQLPILTISNSSLCYLAENGSCENYRLDNQKCNHGSNSFLKCNDQPKSLLLRILEDLYR